MSHMNASNTPMSLPQIHQHVWHRFHAPWPPYDSRLAPMIPQDQYPHWLVTHQCQYYLYLYFLVQLLQPRQVLELGTLQGGSSLFMLLALPEQSQLLTVDASPACPSFLEACQDDPRLKCITGNDLDLSLYGDLDLQGLDLLFLDTEHTCEQVSREWALYIPLLAPGAVVVIDDIHLNEAMERFWQGLRCSKIDTGGAFHWSGLGVVQPGP